MLDTKKPMVIIVNGRCENNKDAWTWFGDYEIAVFGFWTGATTIHFDCDFGTFMFDYSGNCLSFVGGYNLTESCFKLINIPKDPINSALEKHTVITDLQERVNKLEQEIKQIKHN